MKDRMARPERATGELSRDIMTVADELYERIGTSDWVYVET